MSDRSHSVLKHLSPLATIISLLLATCAGCIRATPTPEPVVISFAYPNFDTETYRQLVDEFNEGYPYITVDLRPRRWDATGGLSAGNADVWLTSQFALSWLREQGNVLNLTPFIEQDESFDLTDFSPGIAELYKREGKTWAIPAGVDAMVMFYNKDLFDQYGVAYPQVGWMWDDFLDTTLSLRDAEANVFGYAPDFDFGPLTFIYQHGGRIFDDIQNPTRTTFDDPLTIEALDWYVSLMFDYNVAPTPQQAQEIFGTRGTQAGIHQDKVGLWPGMISERGGRLGPTEWSMRWGMVPLPRDAQAATLTLIEGYFISSQTRHPDACWQWIAFLSRQLPRRQVPARRSLLESIEYERQEGGEVVAVARASVDNALLLSPELAKFEEALQTFGKAFETIVTGRSTPEEAMTWAQRESKFK